MIGSVGVPLTLIATAALVFAERSESRGRMFWKPVASTGFVMLALADRIPDNSFARLLVAGLLFSFIGDVALLGNSERSFLAGLGAFLLAHVSYAGAFWVVGQALIPALLAAILLGMAFVRIAAWLLPHVGTRLRPPVIVYMVAITIMSVLAAGAVGASAPVRLLVGAMLFYLSDLAVARQQFVSPGFVNRAWGLPVYYAAQLVLASAI